nr:CoA transferase [Actinomadura harenae]
MIDGMRPGVLARLGIDHAALRNANERIITVSPSGFGDNVPIANTIAVNDVTAAVVSALTAVLALHHRTLTGEGQRTWDSLAGTPLYLQANEPVRYRGGPVRRPRLGPARGRPGRGLL